MDLSGGYSSICEIDVISLPMMVLPSRSSSGSGGLILVFLRRKHQLVLDVAAIQYSH